MKRTILLTALTVLSSLSLLRAQNESEASTNPMSGLSLEDCIRIAKERNLNCADRRSNKKTESLVSMQHDTVSCPRSMQASDTTIASDVRKTKRE